MRFTSILALSAATLGAASAFSAPVNDPGLQTFLEQFKSSDANAKYLMSLTPQKFSSDGSPISKPKFSPTDIASGDYVTKRDGFRTNQKLRDPFGNPITLNDDDVRAGILKNDRAQDLVDNASSMLVTLESMENYRSATVPTEPWSDTYWPLDHGGAADRFQEKGDAYAMAKTWIERNDFIMKALAVLTGSGAESDVDQLSPAEKYDRLVGDKNFTFTKYNWAQGKEFANDKDDWSWMGFCHGWSPAAFMLARPTNYVTATAADGTQIKFYPADIRALETLLWANANVSSRFIGGRCDIKNPPTTSYGRILSQDCFDTNPGTFHMAAVNQIGVNKRSFVIDATYDVEVWNQPALGYKYSFFNPETNAPVSTIAEATVQKDFASDKFKTYRDPNTVSIVGVSTVFTYMDETDPSAALTNSPANDQTASARYVYDLELDKDKKIIGGEWYENAHPDFIWTPAPNAKAMSSADSAGQGAWDVTQKLPAADAEWLAKVQRASKDGTPMAYVVDGLLRASNGGTGPTTAPVAPPRRPRRPSR